MKWDKVRITLSRDSMKSCYQTVVEYSFHAFYMYFIRCIYKKKKECPCYVVIVSIHTQAQDH